MKKLALSLLFAAVACLQVFAVPAYPGLSFVQQPDGSTLALRLVGDEFFHFNTTSDGYTVVLDKQGYYVYAQKNQYGMLDPTNVVAHDVTQRTVSELALLAATPKNLTDDVAVSYGKALRAKFNVDMSNFDPDKFRGLVILINFKDMKFAAGDNAKALFSEMFGSENYTGYTDPLTGNETRVPGSVRDYFRDQSTGAFNPPFDVAGPYTCSYNAAQCQSKSYSIFSSALTALNSEIDFTQYDSNNDGKVDMVFFLVAGYASSYSGNNSGYLWPHQSYISGTYDGKRMDRYACATELYGYEESPSTVTLNGIGTICHEFSHVLGLPDFYDTDYEKSGGESHNPGDWDVMSGGSYHLYCRYPAGYTLFERYALGWATPKTITAEGSFNLPAVNVCNDGYIVRSPNAKEFFTIENRQKTGWDSYIPGHGMIVTRVDSTNSYVWANNTINCNPNHMYFEMLRAGNTTSGDLASDPFPGTMGNSMITNTTMPSMRTWDGLDNRFVLNSISEKNGVISFKVLEENNVQFLLEDFEDMPATSSTSAKDVEGFFATWSFNKSGVRAPGEGKANDEHSVLMKLPSQFYSTTPVYYNFYMASMVVFNNGAYTAKYSLEYSLDNGATWTKVNAANGSDGAEVASQTVGTCYWPLNLKNNQPAVFRISQVGGNKNASTYVDDLCLYYTGEEGGPDQGITGDVNGDGEVNIADVNAIIDLILTARSETAADVNGDGEVNIADVNAVIDIILSK